MGYPAADFISIAHPNNLQAVCCGLTSFYLSEAILVYQANVAEDGCSLSKNLLNVKVSVTPFACVS